MKPTPTKLTTRQWLPLILVVVALYVIVPQLHAFQDSLNRLHHLDYAQLALACVAVAVTFVLSALTYVLLARKPLRFGRTLTVQVAANFINRLLPAGIGGIGANYRYLRAQKHTVPQAASVVAVNNSLGVIGNLLLVLVLAVVYNAALVPIHLSRNAILAILGISVVILITLLVLPNVRRKLTRSLRSFEQQLKQYRAHPLRLLVALLTQVALTLANVAAFWLCILATHASLGFAPALLVFSFGFGVGNAAPTPGGLGGIEAGLVAGLIAYHIASPTALAAVLTYRLISYWLPLLISAPVFVYATRRRYF